MAFLPLAAEHAVKIERVSRIPPHRDPEAGEVEEGVVGGEQMLMTNQQAAELAEPGVGSLHDPSPLIAAKFAAVFVSPFPVVAAIRHDQFDPLLPKPLAQAVGIVSFCRRSRGQQLLPSLHSRSLAANPPHA